MGIEDEKVQEIEDKLVDFLERPLGIGKLGTLQQIIGIEAATPILNRLKEINQSNNRALGRLGLGRYARPT